MARQRTWFDVANGLCLVAVCVITGLPFLYLILGSLTRASVFRMRGVSLKPTDWTLAPYRYLLAPGSPVFGGLRVSLIVTTAGTLLSVLATVALGYGLSKRGLPGRRFFSALIVITMLFERGMVPLYLVVDGLGLTGSLWSLILPVMIRSYYLFVAVKFCETLPESVQDAARLDGCSEIGVFFRVALPLSRPILATVALFYAVDYWNEWFWPIIFLRDPDLFPLQTVLRGILDSSRVSARNMGAIVISSLPIVLLVVALQRRFMGTLAYLGLRGSMMTN